MNSIGLKKQDEILLDYIKSPNVFLNIPIKLHNNGNSVDLNNLYNISKCSASTTLTAKRDHFTSEIIDFVETPINNIDADARNSMSYSRPPGCASQAVRGSIMNCPFSPAGFEEPVMDLEHLCLDTFELEDKEKYEVPPGFKHGVSFGDENLDDSDESVNLLESLESMVTDEWREILSERKIVHSETESEVINEEVYQLEDHTVDKIIVAKPEILKISETKETKTAEWAEEIDTNKIVLDFNEKIPKPQLTFAFELDNFQKQAIIKLEERENVFVAAHTSAGKTVIAEYAIAISEDHGTKAIYTSPIKALSNQKYHDFRLKFKSVGLITGDLQIDQEASCLIMTTEILRSMLFCGSDITRDLEYVIFDEVHYINDEDRGHVWEEVIMLLPKHVNIIMLSATVPNTIELANWVGGIKRKKVYVIKTEKRPVPLQHYFYTPFIKPKIVDNIFHIVDEEKRFLEDNYKKAKNNQSDKNNQNNYGFGPKQEKNLWSALIEYLKKDKLPVVIFTLSRKRCDLNIDALKGTDLNTAKERARVKLFFQKCLRPFKPDDRNLNQVTTLQDSLERGIGVHHSGILPILKEIVEMLFQKNLVKVLFATETFAMGVNMPARTVVFDSHTKFDGFETRMLKAGEYIQMAGRAGRRGHDKNGNVFVIFRKTLPLEDELKRMMLHSPEKLESKFILRYAVILTCLRNESFRVEELMTNCFKNFVIKKPKNKELITAAEKNLSEISQCDYDESCQKFYIAANKYLNIRKEIMKKLIVEQYKKILQPGKIVVLTSEKHMNKLGLILNVKYSNNKEATITALVLDNKRDYNKMAEKTDIYPEMWHKMISLLPKHKFFIPEGIGGHAVIEIKGTDIINITDMKIAKFSSKAKLDNSSVIDNKFNSNNKLDNSTIVINDWKKRQMDRFRDDPPVPTVVNALTELTILNETYRECEHTNNFLKEKFDDLDLFEDLKRTEKELEAILEHVDIPNFEEEFQRVFKREELKTKIKALKYENSFEKNTLYPDYQGKLKVLRALKHIDENDLVTMRGRIACEMRKNELFIVEIIYRNILHDLDVAEIAALLSGLVFEAKNEIEFSIPNDKIKNCIAEFEDIFSRIEKIELEHDVTTETKLNFGLVEVVYEWTKKKSFVEIMKLTEIQEGIIVRCIQQLDETVKDFETAAVRIANRTFQNKMQEVSAAIKRDIVFTPSLYTLKLD